MTATTLGVSVLTLAFGWSLAGTGPSEPPATSAEPETSAVDSADDFVLPPGYTMLVDDTGRITIAVADSWDGAETAPGGVGAAAVPRISAGDDVEAAAPDFDTPGVLYTAVPFAADEAALYEARFDVAGCTNQEVVPYDDGAFAGQWWRHTGCGAAGDGEFHVVVASPESEVATVIVVVELAGPQDEPALDVALESFNFTPTATWPVTATTVVATTTPTTPTTIPSESSPSTSVATQLLTNNTALLSVSVPADWADVDTQGGVNDNGSYRPAIVAAPSLEDFGQGFAAPGVRVSALPPDVDPTGILANAEQPDDCDATGAAPFDNGHFVGLSQSWAGCAAGAIDVVLVAARPPDSSFTLYAKVQEDAGSGLASMILDSLASTADTSYPTTTSLVTPVTTDGTVPASLWQGPVQADNVIVVDSLRRLRVQVPSAWRDVRNSPSYNDDANPRPRIVASLHIDTMFEQWELPGVVFLEFPFVDAATFLANIHEGTPGCTDGGVQSFDNGEYRGLMHTWIECGGTTTRIVTVVASPPDNSVTLYVEVRQPTEDDTALRTVLASFGQL